MCICAAPRTPFEGVTVYGRPQARDFRQVESFFDERGVIFSVRDVEQDRAGLEQMLTLSGQQEAVVVEIGPKVFIGYTPDALEAILP